MTEQPRVLYTDIRKIEVGKTERFIKLLSFDLQILPKPPRGEIYPTSIMIEVYLFTHASLPSYRGR